MYFCNVCYLTTIYLKYDILIYCSQYGGLSHYEEHCHLVKSVPYIPSRRYPWIHTTMQDKTGISKLFLLNGCSLPDVAITSCHETQ